MLHTNNRSGYKGVSKRAGTDGPYKATMTANRHTVYLGTFITAREAAIAYDRAVLRRRGQDAMTNQRMGLVD